MNLIVIAQGAQPAQVVRVIHGHAYGALYQRFDNDRRDLPMYCLQLLRGQVDLVPEYVGSGLGYYTLADGASEELAAIEVTGDGATNAANLQQALTLAGVDATVLGISAGEDTNAAVVRADTSTELGITKMSDLAAHQDDLVWGIPPDCASNPLCKGAIEAYGITYPPKELVELAACDAPIAEALNQNAVDFAWLCSTQPQIAQYGFVVLEDDLDTQPAENMAPLVRNDFLSVDPAMRGWVNAAANYSQPVAIGDVMRSFAAGEIVGSRHPGFAVGERVMGSCS